MDFFRSESFRVSAKKVLWILLAWTAYSNLVYWQNVTALDFFDIKVSRQQIWTMYKGVLISSLIAGIVGGSVLVGLMERWLRTQPYGRALFYIFVSYTAVWFLVTSVTTFFFQSQKLGLPFTHPDVRQSVLEYFVYFKPLNGYITWLIIVLITLIALMVDNKYGPGVFRAFLMGKYFHPKREERIFMFLDLRSSTSIAEKLGEERYFDFIKKVFRDVTSSIIYSKGEIYQYVGDEIVVSWRMKKGTENANCIRCFFDIQGILLQKKAGYLERYGVAPEFKAGLHHGYVMAGEIGVVKRDIVYSGDVLNTAARIQSKCNEVGVNILLSQFLLERLSLPPHKFQPEKVGDILLRGKQEKVVLYTV